MSLGFSEGKRGRGYWKFNNSLLEDQAYTQLVTEKITDIKTQYAAGPYLLDKIQDIPGQNLQLTINDQLFFEVLLMEIRGLSISYSVKKKKDRLEEEDVLEKDIHRLEKELNSNPNSDLEKELIEKHTLLQDFRGIKLHGQMIRSRINMIAYGEKPSKFFLNLEKRRNVEKTMTSITLDNGIIVNKPTEIMEETKKCYSKLYSNQDHVLDQDDIQDTLKNLEIQGLEDCTMKKLEGPLTSEEVTESLKKMKNGKAPGSDGFTI